MLATAPALQQQLVDLVDAHLASQRTELVATAAAAEEQVTLAIEHCIAYHRGAPCRACPHECEAIRTAICAADAAAAMVAAWLISTGSYTEAADEAALDEAHHLVADAAATCEAERLAFLTPPANTTGELS